MSVADSFNIASANSQCFCLLLTNKGQRINKKLRMMLPGLAEGDEGKGPEGLGHVDIGNGSEFFEVVSEVALCNRLGHPKLKRPLFHISQKPNCDVRCQLQCATTSPVFVIIFREELTVRYTRHNEDKKDKKKCRKRSWRNIQ